MKNITIYLFLSFMLSVIPINAQQIQEADKSPIFETEGSSMATSSIDGDKLLNRSNIDPANTLYGRLNGLTVLQNSSYGTTGETSPTMYIRGIGTLANNFNSILVLIDGMERPLNSLVTEDIESVTILKDAVALALYGMRGANGVLLVTTKRGISGKSDINLSYKHSFVTPSRLPKFANAGAYAEALNEGLINEGLAPRYSSQEIDAYKNQTYPYLFPDVNWMDESLRKWGQRDQIHFSARGGTDRARYFALIDFMSDRGLINETYKNPDYLSQLSSTVLNVRTNLDINLTPTTLMKVGVYGQINHYTEPGGVSFSNLINNLYLLPPNVYPVKNESGSWGGGPATYPANPVAQSSASGYLTRHTRGIYTDLTLKQDLSTFIRGLSIEGMLGMDAASQNSDTRSKQFLSESIIAPLDANGIPGNTTITQYGQDEKELGFSSTPSNLNRFFRLQFRLNYTKDLGPSGNLTSFLLFNEDRKVNPGQFNTFLHQDITAFGHYALKDRYYVDLSLSTSGSSQITHTGKWGFFPAFGGVWRISEEAFLKNSKWLDELKLRFSFGLTGNDRIIYNLDQYQFSSGSGFYFHDDFKSFSGLEEGRLPSQHVTYEKTQMLNIGFEMELFKKLSFNVDMFYNKTYDIMVSRLGTVSSMIGAVQAFEPDGIVKNHGIETELILNDQKGDFKYCLGGQFSFVRNKIVSMNEAYKPFDYLKETGKAVGQCFGVENIGFFSDQADINKSPEQQFSAVFPGDFKYKDQNSDGIVNQYDIIPIGYNDICPEIYYSATIDLSYKRFGISAIFQGISNYSAYMNTPGLYFPLIHNGTISEYYLNNYWKPGGTNTNAKYPRLSTTESNNNYRRNSTFIANASYLKLRSAEMYYKFSTSLVKKFMITECKLFIQGMDLFSIDQIKVVDPEAIGDVFPALKSYLIGFSVTL